MITCEDCDKKEICAIGGYSVAEKCHKAQESVRESMTNLIRIENIRKHIAIEQKDLQDDLWDKLSEQFDNNFDLEADKESFTNSEECDNIMEKYQIDLMKVLSGLEEKLPDWYGIGEDEG